jgi:hypothetical protein
MEASEAQRLIGALDGNLKDGSAVGMQTGPPETYQVRQAIKRSRTRSASTKAGKEASEAQSLIGALDGNQKDDSAVGIQTRPPETSQLRKANKRSSTRSASTKAGKEASEAQPLT